MPRPARTALYTTTAFAVGLIIFAVYQLNSTTVLLAPVKPRMSPAQELVISVISSHKARQGMLSLPLIHHHKWPASLTYTACRWLCSARATGESVAAVPAVRALQNVC